MYCICTIYSYMFFYSYHKKYAHTRIIYAYIHVRTCVHNCVYVVYIGRWSIIFKYVFCLACYAVRWRSICFANNIIIVVNVLVSFSWFFLVVAWLRIPYMFFFCLFLLCDIFHEWNYLVFAGNLKNILFFVLQND